MRDGWIAASLRREASGSKAERTVQFQSPEAVTNWAIGVGSGNETERHLAAKGPSSSSHMSYQKSVVRPSRTYQQMLPRISSQILDKPV
ncbi:hypothetical protein V6N11_009813 [Hibiscus sabdariffa]|uniref:Uncharacterized protein n=2 Tax=Hibiscus sabdariffa TaxID=183260 RepID=A0ABR2DH24_9ROSI